MPRLHEGRHLRHRHGDVVLDVGADRDLAFERCLRAAATSPATALPSCATAASAISPASSAAAKACSIAARTVEGGGCWCWPRSAPTSRRGSRAARRGRARMRLRQLDAEARQQFEADQLIGEAGAAARQQIDGAMSRCGSATRAVARATGLGNSFSAAAVMMPSVPSEPIEQLLADRSRYCPCAAREVGDQRRRPAAPPRARGTDRAHCRSAAR